jgi:hypothetical protein
MMLPLQIPACGLTLSMVLHISFGVACTRAKRSISTAHAGPVKHHGHYHLVFGQGFFWVDLFFLFLFIT